MSGKIDRLAPKIRQRIAPVMAVLSETGRYQKAANHEEQQEAYKEYGRQAEQVARVSEEDVHSPLPAGIQEGRARGCAGGHGPCVRKITARCDVSGGQRTRNTASVCAGMVTRTS